MRREIVQVNGVDLHLRAMGDDGAPLILFLQNPMKK